MTCAGVKPKPRAPGPEHLYKYCKRCNTWKERPSNFSKNHRTPDGLQFYCRYCHNRMTKFNQQRRLEDQHMAETQLHSIKSPKKHTARPATAKTSSFSDASKSTASGNDQPPFDVITSKVPRQQRTHATYRKDSDTLPAANRSQSLVPAQPPRSRSSHDSAGNSKGFMRAAGLEAPHATSVASRPKPSASPACRPEAHSAVELMLHANAVLKELDRVQAAEAATALATAAAVATADDVQPASPTESSTGVAASPCLAARHVPSPTSDCPTRRTQQQQSMHSMHSMPRKDSNADAERGFQVGDTSQQHASSLPVQPGIGSSTNVYSLPQVEPESHTACHLEAPRNSKDLNQPSSSLLHQALTAEAPRTCSEHFRPAPTSDQDKDSPGTEGGRPVASPQFMSAVDRAHTWSNQSSLSPDEPSLSSPKHSPASCTLSDRTASLASRAEQSFPVIARSFSVPRHNWSVPKCGNTNVPEQAPPELQTVASDPAVPAATANPEVAAMRAHRAKCSPPGDPLCC